MVLIIDNFDSFTYNLVQLFGELGQEVRVFRNNAISPEEAERLKPDYIVISPGPGIPEEAGVSVNMIRHFAGRVPVLGVCLGHQSIGEAFGAKICKARNLMHGKKSEIRHDGKTIFSSIPKTFSAARYHSLSVDSNSLPDCLEVSAWSSDGEIMGLRHKEFDVEGVQFHPESVETKPGKRIIENFLNRAKDGYVIEIKETIRKLVDGEDLSTNEMKAVMRVIMEGDATPAQIASFFTALRIKGETACEISAAAGVMREKATKVMIPEGIRVVDTCGTGGDDSHTFNISTVSALIAAGAGVCIAKHGNRSVSSRCGSADLLKKLGVNIDIDAKKMAECIKAAGIGFLFAPVLHSAMKHVIAPRRETGIRSIFNILGPLSNPAFAHAQVLGVYDRDLLPVMAEVLKDLGTLRALVVHGSDGLDEISLSGITYVTELKDGKLSKSVIDPKEFGLEYCASEDIKGGTVEENARIAMHILSGREKGPRRDIALLNAAAAIYVGGESETLYEGFSLASRSIDSGAALKKLKMLKGLSNA